MDSATAISFLTKVRPFPWVLHTISPQNGYIDTACFYNSDQAKQWIERKAHLNVYYAPYGSDKLDDKASKSNVTTIQYLQADLDPADGESPKQFRDRVQQVVLETPPKGVPMPSEVVMSGRGYQLLWRLKEPYEVNGDLQKAEYIENLNIMLLGKYGVKKGGTQNVERILRLPGTINNPHAAKVKKGAEVTPTLHVYTSDSEYSLDDFKLPAQKSTSSKAEVSADIVRVDDLSTLQIDDYLKIVIAQGTHPEYPKEGDNSRSVWQWEATCKLVEAGIDDGRILGILLDSGWKISECILERRDAEEYARKQVSKARAQCSAAPAKVKGKKKGKNKEGYFGDKDQAIAWINKHYFGILNGGKVQFFREEDTGKLHSFGTTEAFCFELEPYSYTQELWEDNQFVGTEELPSFAAWRKSLNRRYYPRGFELNVETTSEGTYNLWKGFAVKPERGDWSLMRDHVTKVLANGDAKSADYILKWAAWALQNPGTPAKVALVFQGGEGVGKGIFANAVKDIFGDNRHGMRVQDMDKLVGKFNKHLRDICLLFCDEAVVTGSSTEGVLKGLITERDIPIEAKGVDVVSSENHLHIIMASNNEWVVPAGAESRRFAVFGVPSKYQGDQTYFKAIGDQMYKNGGLAAMAHDLMEMDLKGWHPEVARPHTDALEEQRVHSLKGFEKVWQDLLITGTLPRGKDLKATGMNSILFQVYASRVNKRDNAPTLNKIAEVLKKSGCENKKYDGRMYWEVLPLKDARLMWNKNFKWPDLNTQEWEDEVFDDPSVF